MPSDLLVFVSTQSGNKKINGDQNYIFHVLQANGVEFERKDVASDPESKENMRKWSGNDKIVPPQIFKGMTYIGVMYSFIQDADMLREAVEEERVKEFLKIE
ncbi:SH3 domain-binding glutamic acid-rich-like protein 3 [Thelohanellus kitauei]|uniref:SH3 domain-binding glutamic acid-rich-like protein 3 n=1 Tax=Thelohanellus kitauei TaxID=669202 RepID=A0A0C2JK32_THEKT|nr:SH3 domain-binding glutamic acid-rich-like protein 3 [Thelohanellus kitauei]